jgi:hypothetical protein
MIESKY